MTRTALKRKILLSRIPLRSIRQGAKAPFKPRAKKDLTPSKKNDTIKSE